MISQVQNIPEREKDMQIEKEEKNRGKEKQRDKQRQINEQRGMESIVAFKDAESNEEVVNSFYLDEKD